MSTGVAEVATIYSLVTGTIDFIKIALAIYEAVKDKDRLPGQLRIVAEKLPSIEQLLATSEQQSRVLPPATWAAVRQNLERCHTGCGEIREIFEEAFPKCANVVHRVWTGAVVVLSGKGKRAEQLLKEVYQELEVLARHQIVTNTDLLAGIKVAVDQMDVGDRSIYNNSGSGPLAVNSGLGIQHVNTNSGPGHQFNAPITTAHFGPVNNFHKSDQRALQDAAELDRFLDSLSFPEIDQRRTTIKSGYKGTLGWLFDDWSEMTPTQGRKYPRTSFTSWLHADAGIYWVSGKPGSGKSTLMARIISDPRTADGLHQWASGRRVLLLHYFFWKPGKDLQKSVHGMLRTLLHRLFHYLPMLVHPVIASMRPSPRFLPSWTAEDLALALHTAIAHASGTWFCIFIDGLDECSGDHDDVLSILFGLQALSSVKCCVASRPVVELRDKLADCEQLRLQDFNQSDIERFVSETFRSLPSSSLETVSQSSLGKLTRDIVDVAKGVFLWAALATKSIVKGLGCRDDFATLHNRLSGLPKDLEELWASIFAKIDHVHLEPLAFYFGSMNCRLTEDGVYSIAMPFPNIAVITAARSPDRIASYGAFARDCSRTELQIVFQSAGLLEISGADQDAAIDSMWRDSNTRVLVPGLFGDGHKAHDVSRQRVHVFGACREPGFLRYEYHRITWVHRSAFDYIFPPGEQQSPIAVPDQLTTLVQLFKGTLEICKAAPSHSDCGDSLTNERVAVAARICYQIEDMGGIDEADQLMTELRAFAVQLSEVELPEDLETEPVLRDGVASSSRPHQFKDDHAGAAYDFWRISGEQHQGYLVDHVDLIEADLPDTAHLMRLLDHLFKFSKGPWMEEGLRVIYNRVSRARAHVAAVSYAHSTFAYRSNWSEQVLIVSCASKMIHLDLTGPHEAHFYAALGRIAIKYNWWVQAVIADNARKPNDDECWTIFGQQLGLLLDLLQMRIFLPLPKGDERGMRGMRADSTQEYRLGPSRRGYSFSIQTPWDVLQSLVAKPVSQPHNRTSPSPQPLQGRGTLGEGDIYLLCMLVEWNWLGAKELHGAIHFRLRSDTAAAIVVLWSWEEGRDYEDDPLHLLLYGTVDQFEELSSMIRADVWANEQGLDATQQLIVLACVRTRLYNWWVDQPSNERVCYGQDWVHAAYKEAARRSCS
ncbi:hypothetical protein LTR27_008316 [Elasticomyces elasticus]|nr:hypothetical protein LTR27_008316 [Elasticomyces elasticus]